MVTRARDNNAAGGEYPADTPCVIRAFEGGGAWLTVYNQAPRKRLTSRSVGRFRCDSWLPSSLRLDEILLRWFCFATRLLRNILFSLIFFLRYRSIIISRDTFLIELFLSLSLFNRILPFPPAFVSTLISVRLDNLIFFHELPRISRGKPFSFCPSRIYTPF